MLWPHARSSVPMRPKPRQTAEQDVPHGMVGWPPEGQPRGAQQQLPGAMLMPGWHCGPRTVLTVSYTHLTLPTKA